MAVLVDENTKVICQGLTGSQGRLHLGHAGREVLQQKKAQPARHGVLAFVGMLLVTFSGEAYADDAKTNRFFGMFSEVCIGSLPAMKSMGSKVNAIAQREFNGQGADLDGLVIAGSPSRDFVVYMQPKKSKDRTHMCSVSIRTSSKQKTIEIWSQALAMQKASLGLRQVQPTDSKRIAEWAINSGKSISINHGKGREIYLALTWK